MGFKKKKQKVTKVIVGIPSTDMVHADFAVSLSMITMYTVSACPDIHLLGTINEKTSIIEKGRSRIAEVALASPADKLLFLDSDMVVPYTIIRRLVDADKDIIGCNYVTHRPPIKGTCRGLDGEFVDPTKTGVQEVGFIGTGCLLIDLKVFRQMGKPYFNVEWDKEKEQFNGEDYVFCKRARAAGFKVFCDLDDSHKVLHLGNTSFILPSVPLAPPKKETVN